MRSRYLLSASVLMVLGLASGLFASARQAGDTTRWTLADAVRHALETHPSVAAARAGETASSAAAGQAAAARYPQVRAQSSLIQFQEPMIVAPLHGFDIRKPPQFDSTLIRGDVSFGYTLYDGGARGSRISSANAVAAGASAARALVEAALASEAARGYLEVLTAQGVLDAQESRREALSAERRRVELLLSVGRAARVELLRVEAAMAEAEAALVVAAARLEVSERELARIAGVSEEQARAGRLGPVRPREGTLPETLDIWLEKARASSLELERARTNAEGAEADHRVAAASRMPEIGAVGGYYGYSSSAGGITAEWQAGVTLSYPLFTGGARSSAIAGAGARAEKAREELRLVELQLERGVDRALTAAVETRALSSALAKGVEHQAEVARIEQLSLEAGAGTQTDYLRAEAELARARSALIEVEHAQVAAWVELARAAGLLSLDWLEKNLEMPR